jgi:hypothetical protein
MPKRRTVNSKEVLMKTDKRNAKSIRCRRESPVLKMEAIISNSTYPGRKRVITKAEIALR